MKPGDLVTRIFSVMAGVQGSVGIITNVTHVETKCEYFSMSADSDTLVRVLWPDQSVKLHYARNLEMVSEAG